MGKICKDVAEMERKRVEERFVRPAQLDGPRLIALAVAGVRDGMARKQVPQVVHFVSVFSSYYDRMTSIQ